VPKKCDYALATLRSFHCGKTQRHLFFVCACSALIHRRFQSHLAMGIFFDKTTLELTSCAISNNFVPVMTLSNGHR